MSVNISLTNQQQQAVEKKIIVKSIASLSDVEKPYLYSGYYKELEPTVTLLKLNDE
ncbi:hypothetical protein PHYBLDRAFT_152150 [Phycomyces blakesleeanus NRRL 1555(-)]|uniref:Uncharacterized protein n=1 Tax=Phycomyces blakesleeanus (strain ATCC 8743b / DSM 1359 / FGSC 10004 / NBRC 33097 / NRRL 1555) TaxID=763407 RepID=A0A162WFY0_PHYB8|nr:hypothetical protein PHYBLDRAFT_152150 [Phycomyces blakesleeanus NRRL 1555(-)]OAD66885.1 hypothetical protein PHYBLDRAFT_152150 [Phycomyces blakesleeanus NRRL 1555(-)]|eukprot:XP_018284925.1 hypothetical protein PHYBLDRAFT_152150 [Phycomyces blakesleeanus NRRL 1555(-)]